jgi:hypothetical protein
MNVARLREARAAGRRKFIDTELADRSASDNFAPQPEGRSAPRGVFPIEPAGSRVARAIAHSCRAVLSRVAIVSMASIVDQLLEQALDDSASIDSVLRKAKVAAELLDLDDMSRWAEHELFGYPEKADVPDYRIMSGEVRGWSPYHRSWQPIVWQDSAQRKKLSSWPIRDSVAEFVDRVERRDQHSWALPLGAIELIGALGSERTNIAVIVDRAVFVNVVSAVRSKILDWALKLKKAGIKGDGLSFSEPEKHKAQQSNITINVGTIDHFTGNVGEISGHATIVSEEVAAKLDLNEVLRFAEQLRELRDLPDSSSSAIREQANELIVELGKPEPTDSRIRGILQSIRAIAEGTAGNVIAAGVIQLATKLLGA